VQEDDQVTEAYKRLFKEDFFGPQYDWMARFAKSIGNIELPVHRDDTAFTVINNNGRVIRNKDSVKGAYYTIDPESSSKDLIKVFGNYHLPQLFINKLRMKKWTKKKK